MAKILDPEKLAHEKRGKLLDAEKRLGGHIA